MKTIITWNNPIQVVRRMPQNAQAKHKAKAKEKKQTQINCSVCLETQPHFLLQKGQLDVLFMNKNMKALIGVGNSFLTTTPPHTHNVNT